jgi:hypothetical protein
MAAGENEAIRIYYAMEQILLGFLLQDLGDTADRVPYAASASSIRRRYFDAACSSRSSAAK